MSKIQLATEEDLARISAPKELRGIAGLNGQIKSLRINKAEWDVLDAHGFRWGLRIANRKQSCCKYKTLHERLRAFNDKLPARVTLHTDVHTRRGVNESKSIEVTMVKMVVVPPHMLGSRPDLDLAVFFEAPDFKTLKEGGAK